MFVGFQNCSLLAHLPVTTNVMIISVLARFFRHILDTSPMTLRKVLRCTSLLSLIQVRFHRDKAGHKIKQDAGYDIPLLKNS